MKILAIETSCDDTGIAILQANKAGDFDVLSNKVASQIEVHQKYGGVFPAMAKREHQKNLVPTFISALKEAGMCHSGLDPESRNMAAARTLDSRFRGNDKKVLKIKEILEREPELEKDLIDFLQNYEKPEVDYIAVTNGPGLEPCLWVGVNFARALSYIWNIPIIPANHIESHILVNFLENKDIKFPAITLVVSGGHTQLILVKGIGKYKILGETRDDAAGECFDKCAKILGLPYPGGPEISKLAEKNDRSPTPIKLPRPMINTKDYDFSFSGLKTAVLYSWQKQNCIDFADRQKTYHKKIASDYAKEIQQAIIDVLLKKTMQAVEDYKAKTLILGGGVSANAELRKQFGEAIKHLNAVEVFVPSAHLSTDNALMTAITAYFHKNKTVSWKKLKADANLRISK